MKIKLNGTVIDSDDAFIYEWLGIPHISSAQLNNLPINGEDLEIELNSYGGSVFAGSEIYTILKSYPGKITITVTGIAASAASVIAMAADVVKISPTAQLMLHNAWTTASGNASDFEKEAEVLRGVNESIANAYMLKTGKSKDELLAIMEKESWFTAEKAIEIGLADEMLFQEEIQPQDIAANIGGGLPHQAVEKIANLIKQPLNIDYDKLADKVAEKLKNIEKDEPKSKAKPKQQSLGFDRFVF